MDFELLPAQKEFFLIPESNTTNRDIALYQGGYGSGRTWVGSLICICLCIMDVTLAVNNITSTSWLIIFSIIIIMFLIIDIVNIVQSKF